MVNMASQVPIVEEHLKTLQQLWNDVLAALKIAAKVMKWKDPSTAFQTCSIEQMVWLEGTNIKTTHLKAKLTSKWHEPFEILYTTPTNLKLQLLPAWHIHPVFHNPLLSPYKEIKEHGPNYNRLSTEIVKGEDKHYKIETIVDTCLTSNSQAIQYLVKWLGYPASKNSWLSAFKMKHAMELVKQFHQRYPTKAKPPANHSLQMQWI